MLPGDIVKVKNSIDALSRISIDASSTRPEWFTQERRIMSISEQGSNVIWFNLEGISMYVFTEDSLIYATEPNDFLDPVIDFNPIAQTFSLGDKVRIIRNKARLREIGVNTSGVLGADFYTRIRTITYIGMDGRYNIGLVRRYPADLLQLVEKKDNFNTIEVGDIVQIIDNERDLNDNGSSRSSVIIHYGHDAFLKEYTVTRGGPHYAIGYQSRYSFTAKNLKLVRKKNETVKIEKQEFKYKSFLDVPVEELASISEEDYYQYFWVATSEIQETLRRCYKIPDNLHYSPIVADYQNKLQLLFGGRDTYNISNKRQIKQCAINYVNRRKELEEDLKKLNEISTVYNKVQAFVTKDLDKEILARSIVIYNKMQRMLFTDAPIDLLKSYKSTTEEYVKYLIQLKNNFDKFNVLGIQTDLPQIEKLQKEKQKIGENLDSIYKMDKKKFSLRDNQIKIQQQLQEIQSKNKKKNEDLQELIEELNEKVLADNLSQVYLESKKFIFSNAKHVEKNQGEAVRETGERVVSESTH